MAHTDPDQTAAVVLPHALEIDEAECVPPPSSIPRRFRDKVTQYRQFGFSEADLTDIDLCRRLLLKRQTHPKEAFTMERVVRNAIKVYCAYLTRVDHATYLNE